MRAMKFRPLVFLLLSFLGMAPAPAAVHIVEDGRPKAEIVIAAERPRMVGLAALELQKTIEKISGARLPITTEPTDAHPVKIYVGRSAGTDRLGVKPTGLKYGAFRMVSGPDWLVLLGGDSDYLPPKPSPTNRNQIEAAVKEWDQVTAGKTDSAWELPWDSVFKSWWNPRDFDEILASRYGAENRGVWNPHNRKWTRDFSEEGGGTGFWMQDEGGSLNAVYAFLRDLGVRWYMPGDLGEVLPRLPTIPLPDINKTETPDFPMRSWFWYNYSGFSFDDTIWARRILLM